MTPPRHNPSSGLSGASRTGRIAGIDLARALAIVGMLAVHVGPTGLEDFAGRLYALPHGRASILFVLVAGIGVSLLAASRSTTPLEARLRLAWHAAVLLPLGLALQALEHNVLVVLQAYAALFLVAVLVLGLADRWLLALAAAFAALGPLAFLAGRIQAPGTFNRSAITLDSSAAEMAHGLVLSGPYPLVTWAAPFLLGMWLGRRNLHAPGLRGALVIGGAALALLAFAGARMLEAALGEPSWPIGWHHLIDHAPHNQMPLWLVGSTGSAMFVLGLALIAADALGRLAWPLVAFGQLALTMYVGHLLALHVWRAPLRADAPGEAAMIVLALTAAAIVMAAAWRALLARGPLELVLQAPFQAARGAAGAVSHARWWLGLSSAGAGAGRGPRI